MGGVKDGIVRVGRRLQLRMFPEETFCWKTHVDLLEGSPETRTGAAARRILERARWHRDQRETLEG